MRRPKAGGGWPAIWYTLKRSREAGGLFRMIRALRSKNACKTCALGMGGQLGGMVNEAGRWPEVCKKSIQAMAADMRGRIHEHFFSDVSLEKLRGFSPRELEAAGRIVEPLIAGPLDSHYKPISWDDALDRIAAKIRKTAPEELFFYFSGRSSNEAGFLLQLFARLLGTNNVNNCSYYCHQASGVALASVTGSGTATIELEDLDLADLVVLVGANPASNHPRFMRTLVDLKRRGGKVIVINPLRELGLEHFRVPSDVRSMLFGSTIADLYVQPHIGGDIALMAALAKRLLERGGVDERFVREHCEGFDAFASHIRGLSWNQLIHDSGVGMQQIDQIVDAYLKSKSTIFAWAMGLTHHEHGVGNVQMIAALAMLRGMLGSPGKGLLPLRGHSNVQGIGSMGVTPGLKKAVFDKLERHFNVKLPTTAGLDTLGAMERAAEGGIRFAWCTGGNLYGSNPDATFARQAVSKMDTVVYLSTTLNTGHACGLGRETIILPVLARDEEQQATTQESMFNYVRLSDGGPRRFEGPRSEVEVIAAVAERVLSSPSPRGRGQGEGAPESRPASGVIDWDSLRQHRNIRQAIAAAVPGYEEVATIDDTKKEFHIHGRVFHEPRFPTDSGMAKFHVVPLPPLKGESGAEGELRLMTIRSEGQFNTVVYDDDDFYRGQERRDVILMNRQDIERLGLTIDQRITVRSATGSLSNVLVREIDIRAGNAAMYYPEANVLIPRDADPLSKTPAFKSATIRIEVEADSTRRATENHGERH